MHAWRNGAADKVVAIERDNTDVDGVASDQGAMLGTLMPYISGIAAKKMFSEGDVDSGILCVGQGIGQMREVLPAAEIVRRTVARAAEIREGLGNAV